MILTVECCFFHWVKCSAISPGQVYSRQAYTLPVSEKHFVHFSLSYSNGDCYETRVGGTRKSFSSIIFNLFSSSCYETCVFSE